MGDPLKGKAFDKRPKAFDYLDYRKYLYDLYTYYNERHQKYSFRYLARRAGFSSPSYLKMVMDGQRKISKKSIQRVTTAFKIKGKQAQYFEVLVLFNQAKTEIDRAHYSKQLVKVRPKAKRAVPTDLQSAYLDRFYYIILREMVALPHFKEDADWIMERLQVPLTPAKIKKALETLTDLNLIKRNEEGRLVQTDVPTSTGMETTAAEGYQFHTSMLEQAKLALWSVDSKKRDIHSLTIPIQKDVIQQIRKRIEIFMEDVMLLINAGGKSYDDVYQVNFQFFPLTQEPEGKEVTENEEKASIA